MASTDRANGFRKTTGGNLDALNTVYATVALACEEIPNVLDGDGVNLRFGKVVQIGTVPDHKEYRWIGGFEDENLKEYLGDLTTKADLENTNLQLLSKIGGINNITPPPILPNITWFNAESTGVDATITQSTVNGKLRITGFTGSTSNGRVTNFDTSIEWLAGKMILDFVAKAENTSPSFIGLGVGTLANAVTFGIQKNGQIFRMNNYSTSTLFAGGAEYSYVLDQKVRLALEWLDGSSFKVQATVNGNKTPEQTITGVIARNILISTRGSVTFECELFNETVGVSVDQAFQLSKAYVDANTIKPATDGKVGGIYVDNPPIKHPRDPEETRGNANYTVSNGKALYMQAAIGTIGNKVTVPFYAFNDSTVTVRLYKSATYTRNPSLMTLLSEKSYPAGTFNKDSAQNAVIEFSNVSRVLAGEWLYIFIYGDSGTSPAMRHFNVDSSASPFRSYFMFLSTNATPWGVQWSLAGGIYYQAAFRFEYQDPNTTALEKRITAIENKEVSAIDPRLAFPSNIKIALGREFNIWHDALVLSYGDDVRIEYLSSNANIGRNKGRSFRHISTGIEAASITAKVYDRNSKLIASKSFNYQSVAKNNGGGATKNILIISDSLGAQGKWGIELSNLFSTDGGMVPYWLGTQGIAPHRHEARPGFSTDSFNSAGQIYYIFNVTGVTVIPSDNATRYTNNGSEYLVQGTNITGGAGTITCTRSSGANNPSASGSLSKNFGDGDSTIAFSSYTTQAGNPFWDATNNRLDFRKYMTDNANFAGTNAIDIVFMMLGINDVLNIAGFNAVSSISNLKSIVDGILHVTRGYPNCKVIIGIPPISCSTKDGFGANYKATNQSDKVAYELRMRILWEAIIASFDNGLYNTNVSLAPTGLMVDRYYGYNLVEENVSARSATKILVHDNAVHPSNLSANLSGHNQICDSVYSAIRSIL